MSSVSVFPSPQTLPSVWKLEGWNFANRFLSLILKKFFTRFLNFCRWAEIWELTFYKFCTWVCFLLITLFFNATLKASGIAVAAECKESFENVKKAKLNRYIIFYIEDEKMIKVECLGDRDADYDQVDLDAILSQHWFKICLFSFFMTWQSWEKVSAVMASSTLSMTINVKVLLRPARSKSFSSCPGALILQRSRKKCCTRQALIHLKRHWLVFTNIFR